MALLFIASGPIVALRVAQANTADVVHRLKVNQCENGNDYRASDLTGWIGLVKLFGPYPPKPGSDPDRILMYERHKDALRDCSKI